MGPTWSMSSGHIWSGPGALPGFSFWRAPTNSARELSAQRRAIRCRDLPEFRGLFSHESSCLSFRIPISYQLRSDGICRNRALTRRVSEVASKVVNNGPCSTTRVGKVNGLESLVPSPSSFFVKFSQQGRSSPSELWSIRSRCEVFVEAFTLFIPAWGVIASTSTWDNFFSRRDHSSVKLLVCLIYLNCVWRWQVRAKLISNAAVLFPVSFAEVLPIHRIAWDGICKSSGCYE